MRNGRYIPDQSDLEAGCLEGPQGRFPAGTRPLDEDVYLPHTVFHGLFGSVLRRKLGSKGGAFTGTLETLAPGAAPGQGVPGRIRDRDDGVIKCGLDMSHAGRHILLYFPGASFLWSSHPFLQCLGLLFLTAADGWSVSFSGPGVGPGPLTPDGQTPPVTQSFITTQVHLPLDIEGDIPAKVALDHVVLVYEISEPDDLAFIKINNPRFRINISSL